MEMHDSLRAGGLVRGSLRVTARAADNIPIDITAHASQSADLLRIRNSSGVELFTVDVNGNVEMAGTMTVVDHDVTDDFTVTDRLTVGGTATFNGDVVVGDGVTDSLTVNANAEFVGSTRCRGVLNANNVNISGTLTLPTGTAVGGPGSSTDNAVMRWNGTTGDTAQNSIVSIDDSGVLAPVTTDTGSLGSASLMWSDLFLASGAVVNFDNGNVTLTHSAAALAFAGATGGYSFDNEVVITGDDNPLLDLNPSSTATQTVIDIAPSAAIGSSAVWKAVNVAGTALDPSASGAEIYGLYADFSGVSLTNEPDIEAVKVIMPASYTGQGDLCAFDAEGNGMVVEIIDNDKGQNAVYVQGGAIQSVWEFASTAESSYTPLLVNMDVSNLAASSSAHALNVNSVGSTSGDVSALGVGAGVDVIHQHTGTFSSPSQTEYAARFPDGGAWTDGIDGNQIFVADNDAIYIGDSAMFDELEVILTTPASQDVLAEYYYYNTSAAWVQFFPTDGTNGFRNDGIVEWDSSAFTNWKSDYDPGAADGSAGYYIKVVRTRNTVVTPPTPTTIKILADVNYSWDSSGDLTVGNVTVKAAGALRTGTTATDTLLIQAYDNDTGPGYVTFITLTAGNTPTCALSGDVTGVTQSPNDNSTKLATTAYVDAQVATADGLTEILSVDNTSGAYNIFMSDGQAIVIGHESHLTIAGGQSTLQVLGTAVDDGSLTLGVWSETDSIAPALKFFKSGHASISASNLTSVADDELVGSINFYPAEGATAATLAAQFLAEVDDATPASGDVGMAFVWKVMPGGGGGLAEHMRLGANGTLTVTGLTDGTFSVSSGAFTGVSSITDGTASWSSNALTGFTSVTAGTLSLTGDSNQIVLDSDDGSGFTTTITDSATAARVLTLPDETGTLATQAYVATQLATQDALSEILAVGNTTGAYDIVVDDGQGIIVGHTALLTVGGGTSELQVFGTAGDDSTLTLGCWSNTDSVHAALKFWKSSDATISASNYTALADNEIVGAVEFYPADGSQTSTLAASIVGEVDDATPAAGDVGMALTFNVMPGGGGGAVAEAMRISAAKNVDIVGDLTAAVFMPDGDTSSGDAAAVGYTATEGLILTGQGSSYDVTIKNDADGVVLTVATGTTNVDVVGDVVAACFIPDGDTSSGDSAAIGYTATEGLILTGQGSTSDVTIKNDADGTVLTLPTGTTNLLFGQDGTVGRFILAEKTSIDLDGSFGADGDYTGTTIEGTAGATLAFGDVIYLDPTDSRWELVDANAAAAADGDARGTIGICVLAAASDGNATRILLQGMVRADTAFPALTVNEPVYASETAGDIVLTPPSTTDAVVRTLGFCIDANTIYFNPSSDYITAV